MSSQILGYINIFYMDLKYVESHHWQMQKKDLSLYFNT